MFSCVSGLLEVYCSAKTCGEHLATVELILQSSEASNREKGIANTVKRNILASGKRMTDIHNITYVGKTDRILGKRLEEHYPWAMEMFGVTHECAIAVLPKVNETWYLLVESAVAGIMQSSTNMVRANATSSSIHYEPLSFVRLIMCNLVHCGDVKWEQSSGKVISKWLASNGSRHLNEVAETLFTVISAILVFIDRY